MRRGGGFTWRGRSFRIGLESATILLRFRFEMATIFASKRPTIEVLVSRRSFSDRLEAIASRKLPDRGSIGPRSWSSSTKPLNRLMGSSWMNDRDSPIPCAAITMRVLRQPSDRDRLSMKISHPIAINSRPSIDADRELLRMPRGAKSSDGHHLSPPFAHVMDLTIAWTRVHAIVAVLIASDVR